MTAKDYQSILKDYVKMLNYEIDKYNTLVDNCEVSEYSYYQAKLELAKTHKRELGQRLRLFTNSYEIDEIMEG